MGRRERTSLIMSCSSASVGFWPSDRITVPNSLVVTVPATSSQAQAQPGGPRQPPARAGTPEAPKARRDWFHAATTAPPEPASGR